MRKCSKYVSIFIIIPVIFLIMITSVVIAASATIAIREDGILMINEEPFFPVGAYRDPSDTLTNFDSLKEAGFNLTHSYFFEERAGEPVLDDKSAATYLEEAERNGFKVFMGLDRNTVKTHNFEAIRNRVEALRKYPALLGWYLMDEPEYQGISPELLSKVGNLVKSIDPLHPTITVTSRPDCFAKYQKAVDILWTDPYPVPYHSVSMVSERVQAAVRAVKNKKPVWAVIQVHDLERWKGHKSLHELRENYRPTPKEIRIMTYLAISSGAKGIIYYWLPHEYKLSFNTYHIKKDVPKIWEGLKRIVKELRRLTPILVAKRKSFPVICSEDTMNVWTQLFQRDGYVIASNPSNFIDQVKFIFPNIKSAGKVEVLFEDRELSVENGVFFDKFGELEVHIYQIKNLD